jgi:surfeit locus 1 family protein
MPETWEKGDLSDQFKAVSDELDARRQLPRGAPPAPAFILFMLALTVLFAALGVWQLNRLDEKEQIIARIEERAARAPIPLPPVAEWVGFDAEIWDYRPVELTGSFLHDQTILVFTSLTQAQGEFSGPGYWVVAPLVLADGGLVFVNRGFVPQDLRAAFATGGAAPEGEVTVTGLARISEAPNSFTPGTDTRNRIEWVRNIERMTSLLTTDPLAVAPVYVDQSAGDPGTLPQAGETRLTIANRHFEYALTWLALAIITPLMLLVWVFARRKP